MEHNVIGIIICCAPPQNTEGVFFKHLNFVKMDSSTVRLAKDILEMDLHIKQLTKERDEARLMLVSALLANGGTLKKHQFKDKFAKDYLISCFATNQITIANVVSTEEEFKLLELIKRTPNGEEIITNEKQIWSNGYK